MIDVVSTDFGVVKLSPQAVAYLDSISKDWRDVAASPERKRDSKRKRFVRNRVKAVEAMVCTLACIEWQAGNKLAAL